MPGKKKRVEEAAEAAKKEYVEKTTKEMSFSEKAKKKAEEDKKRAEAAKKEYVEKTTKKME